MCRPRETNGVDLRRQRRLPVWFSWMKVVMDSLRTHHVQAVGELLRDAGVAALYLPAYSPDLNPIE